MHFYSKVQWVDEYVKNITPYIFVREEDHILIKIPNEAYKLNPQGIKILKYLLKGESVYSIIDTYTNREKISYDIHCFFCDLKAMLKGCLSIGDQRKFVEERTFSLPFNSLPVLSEIAVTYRCNLTCAFCYASCGCRRSNENNELPLSDLKDVLRIIKEEALVPSVSFTGGEPTLREDLPELISYAKSLGMWTNLITNGTRITRSYAHELKRRGLDSAQVSIEAPTSFLHDRIVKKEGAFFLSWQGLRALKKENIRVHTNTTISKLNRDYLLPLLDKIKQQGMTKFSMNMLMPEGSALSCLSDILIRYSEIGKIVLGVNQYAKKLNLEFMWYSPTPMCIFNPILYGLGNKGCAACDGLLSISPDGQILPCSSYPEPQGNILEQKNCFQEFWRSERIQYFKEKRFAHDICQQCPELAVCHGGCPLYWKHVGYEEILSQGQEVCV